MATETEIMKTRLGADPNGSAAAAVATEARIFTAPIGEVVMTMNAVHRAMFVVGKTKNQRFTAMQERFTQGQSRAATQQCKQHDQRGEDDRQYEPRMPPKREADPVTRGLRIRMSLGARTQQCQQNDARQQRVCDGMCATMHVTTRSDYMHCQSDHQQAGCADMRGLEVPVARPKTPAHRSVGRHGEEDQREQCQDPGIFVTGGGQLDMLNDPLIYGEQ